MTTNLSKPAIERKEINFFHTMPLVYLALEVFIFIHILVLNERVSITKNMNSRNDINSYFFLSWCHFQMNSVYSNKKKQKSRNIFLTWPYMCNVLRGHWRLLWKQTHASWGWSFILWDGIAFPLMKQ